MKVFKIRKGLRAITNKSSKHRKSLYKSKETIAKNLASDLNELRIEEEEHEEEHVEESRVVVMKGILAELEYRGLNEHLLPIGDDSARAKSNVAQAVKFMAKFLSFNYFSLSKGEAFYQEDILTTWYLQMFRVNHDVITKFCKQYDASPKSMLSYLTFLSKLTT